ncbi:4Fe-4S binding protein [Oscillospiraceae bacterium MB08-C2-2]|nr:4Fe-4S binding protein [Oscillospiraceae bacterium MB08-C2-2]
MKEGILFTGVPSPAELAASPGFPDPVFREKGRIAVIECVQEIPCNPCEGACKWGAIQIGDHITNLPALIPEKCTGCGICIANCPGLAITVIDNNFSETESSIDFPFEYLPLPKVGDVVEAVNRMGESVCRGRILAVKRSKAFVGTTVVSMAVPKEYQDIVRSMKRLPIPEKEGE